MAKRGKDRRPVLRVQVEFRKLEPVEWGKIFSVYWPPVMRPVAGSLFIHGGIGPATKIIECHSQAMQMNRIFIKHSLPYRLRYRLVDPDRYADYIKAREIRLCTVTKSL